MDSKYAYNHFYYVPYKILLSVVLLCSTLEPWKTKIDATYNYWGFNTTAAVGGRIRDLSDDPRLLEVNYTPFYMNNATILDVKCPPGWNLVGDTCYIYIGAPMTFYDARAFCQVRNNKFVLELNNICYLICRRIMHRCLI